MVATLDTNNPPPAQENPKKGLLYAGLKSGSVLGGGGAKTGGTGGLMGGLFGMGMLKKLAANQGISSLSKFAQTQAGLQRGYVTEGTRQAEQSLMQGYRQAYAQRAAGIAGSYGLQADQLLSEMASQGLDPSIARRMLAQQRGSSLQQLGEAQGGLASEMFDNLARLQKGTGGELAAISQAETEQYLAPNIAKMSADATKAAAKSEAKGNILGAIIGKI